MIIIILAFEKVPILTLTSDAHFFTYTYGMFTSQNSKRTVQKRRDRSWHFNGWRFRENDSASGIQAYEKGILNYKLYIGKSHH